MPGGHWQQLSFPEREMSGQHNHNDRLNGDLRFVHGSLAELEAGFLRQRICAVQECLDDKLPSLSELRAGSNPLAWWRIFQFEPVRCEGEVLSELLHSRERQTTHLEEMLALRLSALDSRLERLAFNHQYDEAYWELEIEHHVVTKILNDWWHWLQQG
ncbi:MAG: hypothetical protein Kow0031_33270 [Anaerolineae bacterium]